MVSIAIQMLYAIFCKQLNRDTLSKNIQMKKAKWSLKSRGGLQLECTYLTVYHCNPQPFLHTDFTTKIYSILMGENTREKEYI